MTIDLIQRVLKGFWQLKIRRKPFVLSHEVNSECNLRCDFCSNWRNDKDELSKNEVFELIEEAKRFGMLLYNIWGTEPLLREGLDQIIDYANEKDLLTSLVTNGVLLKNKIKKIQNLDYLTVSLDGLSVHEEIRDVDVDNILEGIEAADERDVFVGINCVINKRNLSEIPDLIDYCNKNGFPISFEPVYEYGEIGDGVWDKYSLKGSEELNHTVKKIKEMKKSGAPIINSFTYLDKINDLENTFCCKSDLPIMHIDSEGELKVCRVNNQQLGSYKKGLGSLWEETKQKRNEITEECDGCFFFGYVESCYMNKLKIEPIRNAMNFI